MSDKSREIWNPDNLLDIDPAQFEEIVANWLARTEPSFRITHQARLLGRGGEYGLDALAEAEIFGGAKIRVIIECKKHTRPVNRDVVLGVHSKMIALGLSKAIIFSTSGFQRGAIDYASEVGMALVTVIDGAATYETRSAFPVLRSRPRYWLPPFAGRLLSASGEVICVSTFSDDRLEALQTWLLRP